jgi:hypothetical protein
MKTLHGLQSVQAIFLKGHICIRVHPNTVTALTEAGHKQVLVEYWGNYYIRTDLITREIAQALTQIPLPTDSED